MKHLFSFSLTSFTGFNSARFLFNNSSVEQQSEDPNDVSHVIGASAAEFIRKAEDQIQTAPTKQIQDYLIRSVSNIAKDNSASYKIKPEDQNINSIDDAYRFLSLYGKHMVGEAESGLNGVEKFMRDMVVNFGMTHMGEYRADVNETAVYSENQARLEETKQMITQKKGISMGALNAIEGKIVKDFYNQVKDLDLSGKSQKAKLDAMYGFLKTPSGGTTGKFARAVQVHYFMKAASEKGMNEAVALEFLGSKNKASAGFDELQYTQHPEFGENVSAKQRKINLAMGTSEKNRLVNKEASVKIDDLKEMISDKIGADELVFGEFSMLYGQEMLKLPYSWLIDTQKVDGDKTLTTRDVYVEDRRDASGMGTVIIHGRAANGCEGNNFRWECEAGNSKDTTGKINTKEKQNPDGVKPSDAAEQAAFDKEVEQNRETVSEKEVLRAEFDRLKQEVNTTQSMIKGFQENLQVDNETSTRILNMVESKVGKSFQEGIVGLVGDALGRKKKNLAEDIYAAMESDPEMAKAFGGMEKKAFIDQFSAQFDGAADAMKDAGVDPTARSTAKKFGKVLAYGVGGILLSAATGGGFAVANAGLFLFEVKNNRKVKTLHAQKFETNSRYDYYEANARSVSALAAALSVDGFIDPADCACDTDEDFINKQKDVLLSYLGQLENDIDGLDTDYSGWENGTDAFGEMYDNGKKQRGKDYKAEKASAKSYTKGKNKRQLRKLNRKIGKLEEKLEKNPRDKNAKEWKAEIDALRDELAGGVSLVASKNGLQNAENMSLKENPDLIEGHEKLLLATWQRMRRNLTKYEGRMTGGIFKKNKITVNGEKVKFWDAVKNLDDLFYKKDMAALQTGIDDLRKGIQKLEVKSFGYGFEDSGFINQINLGKGLSAKWEGENDGFMMILDDKGEKAYPVMFDALGNPLGLSDNKENQNAMITAIKTGDAAELARLGISISQADAFNDAVLKNGLKMSTMKGKHVKEIGKEGERLRTLRSMHGEIAMTGYSLSQFQDFVKNRRENPKSAMVMKTEDENVFAQLKTSVTSGWTSVLDRVPYSQFPTLHVLIRNHIDDHLENKAHDQKDRKDTRAVNEIGKVLQDIDQDLEDWGDTRRHQMVMVSLGQNLRLIHNNINPNGGSIDLIDKQDETRQIIDRVKLFMTMSKFLGKMEGADGKRMDVSEFKKSIEEGLGLPLLQNRAMTKFVEDFYAAANTGDLRAGALQMEQVITNFQDMIETQTDNDDPLNMFYHLMKGDNTNRERYLEMTFDESVGQASSTMPWAKNTAGLPYNFGVDISNLRKLPDDQKADALIESMISNKTAYGPENKNTGRAMFSGSTMEALAYSAWAQRGISGLTPANMKEGIRNSLTFVPKSELLTMNLDNLSTNEKNSVLRNAKNQLGEDEGAYTFTVVKNYRDRDKNGVPGIRTRKITMMVLEETTDDVSSMDTVKIINDEWGGFENDRQLHHGHEFISTPKQFDVVVSAELIDRIVEEVEVSITKGGRGNEIWQQYYEATGELIDPGDLSEYLKNTDNFTWETVTNSLGERTFDITFNYNGQPFTANIAERFILENMVTVGHKKGLDLTRTAAKSAILMVFGNLIQNGKNTNTPFLKKTTNKNASG